MWGSIATRTRSSPRTVAAPRPRSPQSGGAGCKQQNVYCVPPVEDVTVRYRIAESKRIARVSLFVHAAYSKWIDGNMLYVILAGLDNYQPAVNKTALSEN